MRDSLKDLKYVFKSKLECIWITSVEETDVISDIRDIVLTNFPGYQICLWSCTEGLTEVPLTIPKEPPSSKIAAADVQSLFKEIRKTTFGDKEAKGCNRIYILRDFDKLLSIDNIRRIRDLKELYLKEFYCANKQYKNRYYYNPIIIISTSRNIPSDISKIFYSIDYDLLNKEEVSIQVDKACRVLKKQSEIDDSYVTVSDKNILSSITDACCGLTRYEINSILKESISKFKTLDLNFISQFKIQSIKKSGVLDYKIPKLTLDDIGGNTSLKKWLYETKDLFSEEAAEFGIPKPKGYMSVGIPGCGKTALAEAFAGTMKTPLLILSISKVMNRMVGESEKKIVQALQVAKACAPCVLLLDECEKVLGGVNSSNSSDGGTIARVFQEILKFLNDNDNGVFVIMTTNDISQLPPEFTRSGRLDAQWYFGLPKEDERKEIFNLKFNKFKIDVDEKLLNLCILNSKNFTGAEIEEMVKICMKKAFVRYKKTKEKNITEEDIISSSKEIIPVYESSKEKILALELYCKGRARRTDEENETKNNDSEDDSSEDDNLFW